MSGSAGSVEAPANYANCALPLARPPAARYADQHRQFEIAAHLGLTAQRIVKILGGEGQQDAEDGAEYGGGHGIELDSRPARRGRGAGRPKLADLHRARQLFEIGALRIGLDDLLVFLVRLRDEGG